jgi:hypothetical protein
MARAAMQARLTRSIQLARIAARWGSSDGYGPKRIATTTRFLLRASFDKKRLRFEQSEQMTFSYRSGESET